MANGITIGVGATVLAVGLFLVFSLNAIYNQQISYLAALGVEVSNFGLGLDNLIFLLSFSALLAIMGVYLLAIGTLVQLSPRVRAAWERKDSKSRMGTGLISGGFTFASLTAASGIRDLYFPVTASWYTYAEVSLVVIGLLMILAGALFIRSSYLKSR